jgi:hypothetical protein
MLISCYLSALGPMSHSSLLNYSPWALLHIIFQITNSNLAKSKRTPLYHAKRQFTLKQHLYIVNFKEQHLFMQDILLAHILVRKTRKNHLYVTFARKTHSLMKKYLIRFILSRIFTSKSHLFHNFSHFHNISNKSHLFFSKRAFLSK